jgi:hypothetical protein
MKRAFIYLMRVDEKINNNKPPLVSLQSRKLSNRKKEAPN